MSPAVPPVLLGAGALVGTLMARQRVKGRPTPSGALAALHGLFVASGLLTMLLVVFGQRHDEATATTGASRPVIALVFLFVAAVGGGALTLFHRRGRALPLPLLGAHALAALLGLLLLVLGLLNSTS